MKEEEVRSTLLKWATNLGLRDMAKFSEFNFDYGLHRSEPLRLRYGGKTPNFHWRSRVTNKGQVELGKR